MVYFGQLMEPGSRSRQLFTTVARWASSGLDLLRPRRRPGATHTPPVDAGGGLNDALVHAAGPPPDQRLQESEERYRRLLGRIQDGVVIIQDGRLVYANEVFARMVGDPEGSFLGGEFLELLLPEDRPQIAERYHAWEESQGVSGSLEAHVRTRGGETLLVIVRAGGVELQGKRSVIATVRDITLQRTMEREVREHARRLAALNEIADAVNESLTIEDIFAVAASETHRLVPCDVVTFALPREEGLEVVAVGDGDARRTVVDASAAAWALAGPRLWVRGGGEPPPRCTELLAGADLASMATVPLRSKDRVIGSFNLGRRSPVPFSGDDLRSIEPVARHIAIALGNARLLEDVRVANRRLSELDHRRREYLRNVSHEFRTPLTVIRGYAEFLLESASGPQQAMMKALVESCDRVIDLVETLIEVSRIEQAGAEGALDVRRLDLREVAESSVEALRWLAARKGIQVELDFAGADFGLEADSGLLQHVVRKLVDNALKYSPPGARVCVRARTGEEDMRLEVEDSGIGIPAEHLSRIFDKFYVVDGGIDRRVGGTGVGLYLVREIVRLHRGSVEVKSLPGEGSVFCVRLPRHFQGPRAALA
jgi:PAS domain S-box-containing protein